MRKKYQQFHSAISKAFKFAFLMLFLLSNWAIALAQSPSRKISVTCNDEPLASALKKVEKASGYKFLFTYDEVQSYKVSLHAKKQAVSSVLKQMLSDLPFAYKFNGNYINVTKSAKRSISVSKGGENGSHTVRGIVLDEFGGPIPGVNIIAVDKHL